MYEGWDEINPYEYEITEGNVFVVKYKGEEVHRSRSFRLKVQAEKKAVEWIQNETGEKRQGDITLDVQTLSVDPTALFGGKDNG